MALTIRIEEKTLYTVLHTPLYCANINNITGLVLNFTAGLGLCSCQSQQTITGLGVYLQIKVEEGEDTHTK